MKNRLFLCVITIIFLLILAFQAQAQTVKLTDQEIIETAKLIQALKAENRSLKEQVALLQSGLEQERQIVAQLNQEMQFLIASYDRRIQYSDQTLAQMEILFNKSTALTKEAEVALQQKDRELWIWRALTLGAAAWGVSR